MSSPNLHREIHYLVLQYLNEHGFEESAYTLGRETGLYFSLNHFEKMVLEGKWDEAENYLSGFALVKEILFEMKKQKYLEALDNNERDKAMDILIKEIKVYIQGNEKLMKDLSYLLMVDDIRQIIPSYTDVNSIRMKLMAFIKRVILGHPLLSGKLNLPFIENIHVCLASTFS
ncbi:protein TOPLESS-RELATED PROTEIN 2 [Cajanus cajan]|uniref:protein TOPLESS-RELATED PROTEIN 2 n=1 Tax=Cajanus cajan TaxID=3821 RepID=UPI00098DA090|nr:protein TOPLESS-RELATED PROTEIN 2 [Cajanus cajan]